MNKTQKRATQKHRAKKAKIAVKRKAEAAQQTPAAIRARAQTAAAPATRSRTAPKRQDEGATEGVAE